MTGAGPAATDLTVAMHDRVLVLDGGLATQLGAMGHDLSDDLWSARLLADDPAAIVSAHLAFVRAGADVITTASYQATIEGFTRRGLDRPGAAALLRRSVALARDARDRARAEGLQRPLWIAASVGPYGAMLADGSEYRGNYGLSVAELVRFHRPRLEILAEAGPDVLALETIPDAREAEAVLTALAGLGVPAWLSYTIDGESTRAGQPLAEAFGLAREHDEIIAVGVNCCAPTDVAPALRHASAHAAKPAVAYPNSGETWDASTRTWTGRVVKPPVREWISGGARLVGGCCRVTPADIAVIAGSVAAQQGLMGYRRPPGLIGG